MRLLGNSVWVPPRRPHGGECTGKIGHETRAQAKKAAKRTSGWDGEKGRLTQYVCSRCGLWHNGRRRP